MINLLKRSIPESEVITMRVRPIIAERHVTGFGARALFIT